jgi:hypothetical protein
MDISHQTSLATFHITTKLKTFSYIFLDFTLVVEKGDRAPNDKLQKQNTRNRK